MAVIDKDGNVFDVTPSGGWIPGAVILGDTGIGMSVRGEQFWLDKTMANQIRPRARPRYTLTPSMVFSGDTPLMALGTPGGDNQDQTIIQAFLNIVEFWDDWYPNLHAALEWPRFQTLHFHGSFWPHSAGFNKLNLEADDSGRRVQRAQGARARRQPHPAVRHVGLRDDGDDRSGDAEPLCRRRSAARLLRAWRTSDLETWNRNRTSKPRNFETSDPRHRAPPRAAHRRERCSSAVPRSRERWRRRSARASGRAETASPRGR